MDSTFYNLDAERSLLGFLLLNNELYDEVSVVLNNEHFYDTAHQNIFKAIKYLLTNSQEASIITVDNLCKYSSEEGFKNVKSEHLLDLINSVTNLGSHNSYVSIIYDLYIKRQIVAIKDNIQSYLENIGSSQNILENIEKDVFLLSERGDINNSTKTFEESLVTAYENILTAKQNKGKLSGYTTGLRDLDIKLSGLQKSDLIVLAGRPSMGKTALATNIAFNCARALLLPDAYAGASAAIFSLEMSAEQIAGRILSSNAGISSDALKKGLINDNDFNRLVEVMQELSKVKLFIDDTPGISISQLRTKCRKLKRKHNIGVVVIDYIQLLYADKRSTGNSRHIEIGEITRGLKEIAKELNIPIIALSQLSRAVESREDKKPILADLRESGSIEQDADIVSFIFREEYYVSREEPTMQKQNETVDEFETRKTNWKSRMESCKNKATVIIAKNRHGSIGNIDLHFQPEHTLFGNIDHTH